MHARAAHFSLLVLFPDKTRFYTVLSFQLAPTKLLADEQRICQHDARSLVWIGPRVTTAHYCCNEFW